MRTRRNAKTEAATAAAAAAVVVEEAIPLSGAQSSDDDEAPEEVSNASMKSSSNQLTKNMDLVKNQMKMAEKEKRKRKQELFIEQKKAKITKLADDSKEDNADGKEQTKDTKTTEEISTKLQAAPKLKPTRKVYPDLNIVVEPLSKVDDTRASAALDFKSRRLTKSHHRESVQNAVISYQKKLQARK